MLLFFLISLIYWLSELKEHFFPFCQVLSPDMSLATVRTYIWKKPEDLVLNYRVVQGRWWKPIRWWAFEQKKMKIACELISILIHFPVFPVFVSGLLPIQFGGPGSRGRRLCGWVIQILESNSLFVCSLWRVEGKATKFNNVTLEIYLSGIVSNLVKEYVFTYIRI